MARHGFTTRFLNEVRAVAGDDGVKEVKTGFERFLTASATSFPVPKCKSETCEHSECQTWRDAARAGHAAGSGFQITQVNPRARTFNVKYMARNHHLMATVKRTSFGFRVDRS